MADATEEEAAAVLGALGVTVERQRKVREVPRTPLPSPGGAPSIQSEVEWI
ncbi:hypothetical protein ACFC09_11265 [Streptomyces sp. NPDC056161]|uniref:hypothetical protein n=1 Tax=Streptomyces sp. NPDC056161 TaxID=3345732 RepID=UPI0035D776E7